MICAYESIHDMQAAHKTFWQAEQGPIPNSVENTEDLTIPVMFTTSQLTVLIYIQTALCAQLSVFHRSYTKDHWFC